VCGVGLLPCGCSALSRRSLFDCCRSRGLARQCIYTCMCTSAAALIPCSLLCSSGHALVPNTRCPPFRAQPLPWRSCTRRFRFLSEQGGPGHKAPEPSRARDPCSAYTGGVTLTASLMDWADARRRRALQRARREPEGEHSRELSSKSGLKGV